MLVVSTDQAAHKRHVFHRRVVDHMSIERHRSSICETNTGRLGMHSLNARSGPAGSSRFPALQVLESDSTKIIAGARSPENSQLLQELQQQYPERLCLLMLDVTCTSSIKVCSS